MITQPRPRSHRRALTGLAIIGTVTTMFGAAVAIATGTAHNRMLEMATVINDHAKGLYDRRMHAFHIARYEIDQQAQENRQDYYRNMLKRPVPDSLVRSFAEKTAAHQKEQAAFDAAQATCRGQLAAAREWPYTPAWCKGYLDRNLSDDDYRPRTLYTRIGAWLIAIPGPF